MADVDDTSAGLTAGERKRTMRRRASRSAGPASGNGSGSVSHAPTEGSGTAPTGTITLEKNRSPVVEADGSATEVPSNRVGKPAATTESLLTTESAAEAEGVTLPLSEREATAEEWHPTAPMRSRGPLAAAIALGLVTVALLGVLGWLLFERAAAGDRDARRQAFEDTAQQTMLNMTTIKPDTAKEDVDKILAGASGEFKAEFDLNREQFVNAVKDSGVTTVGKIVATGMESDNGDTAKVLVVARADVSSPGGSQDGPRDFRMRVTVTDNDGTLTASKVEFVP